MTVDELQRLHRYGVWANGKVFAAVAALSAEEFTGNVAGSYGSVRNTLVHAMSAQWGWMERCGGFPRGPALKAEDFSTPESLITKWRMVEGKVEEFLAGLSGADLARIISFEFPAGEKHSIALGALMQHGALHAIHHRGQAALLLRMLGRPADNFDLLFYDAEREPTG